MTLETWFAFAGLWLTFALVPGPSALFCVSIGLRIETPTSYGAALGIALGSIVHALVAALGVGAVLMASAELFGLVKWLGVGYLVYLALRQWRTPLIFRDPMHVGRPRGSIVVVEGLLVMLTNPKSTLGYAAVLPLFIDPAAPLSMQVLVLTATTTVIAFVVNAGFVLFATPLRRLLSSPFRERMAKRGLASLFLLGAVGLAVSDRR